MVLVIGLLYRVIVGGRGVLIRVGRVIGRVLVVGFGQVVYRKVRFFQVCRLFIGLGLGEVVFRLVFGFVEFVNFYGVFQVFLCFYRIFVGLEFRVFFRKGLELAFFFWVFSIVLGVDRGKYLFIGVDCSKFFVVFGGYLKDSIFFIRNRVKKEIFIIFLVFFIIISFFFYLQLVVVFYIFFLRFLGFLVIIFFWLLVYGAFYFQFVQF